MSFTAALALQGQSRFEGRSRCLHTLIYPGRLALVGYSTPYHTGLHPSTLTLRRLARFVVPIYSSVREAGSLSRPWLCGWVVVWLVAVVVLQRALLPCWLVMQRVLGSGVRSQYLDRHRTGGEGWGLRHPLAPVRVWPQPRRRGSAATMPAEATPEALRCNAQP
jgi:hypothetical protein